jgi:tyrosine-protein phosphatase YwqE
VGYYGNQISKTAEKLLLEGMYDYVGSDVHHDNHINAFNQKVLLKDVLPLQEIIKNNQFLSIISVLFQ